MLNEVLSVILSLNVHTVYLTFDDGPDPKYTNQVLSILKDNNMKATFFLIGEKVNKYPDLVRKEIAEGHHIGGHSMTHRQLTKIPLYLAQNDVVECMDLVNKYQKTDLFRFPYGDFNKDLDDFVKKKGYYNVYWDLDTTDWKYKDKDKIYSKFLVRILKSKDGAIILMHDIHPQTIESLKMIVEFLKDNKIETKVLPKNIH